MMEPVWLDIITDYTTIVIKAAGYFHRDRQSGNKKNY